MLRSIRRVGIAGWLPVLLVLGCGRDQAAPDTPVGFDAGQRAPALSGQLAGGGGAFDLASDARRPVILEFYLGSHCGLCRMQLTRLQRSLPLFEERGAQVVAATAAPPDEEVNGGTVDGVELTFTRVMVDSATLQRWGVVNGEGRGGVGTFVLDRAGVIRFSHIGRNAADRVSDADLLTILEQMAGER